MKLVERIRKTSSASQKITLNTVFRDEDGAIDLASIMVGVIVIGLIGGAIAATVFAVIPWSQDNAAKQQLDSIVQAENAYFGLSAANPSPLPAGTPANSFGKSTELETAKLLKTGQRYCATTPDDKKSYTGYSQSSSGKIFTVTDKNTKAIPFTESIDLLPADCKFITEGMTPATDTSPVPTPTPTGPYVDPTPTKTILTYKCDTTVANARIPFASAVGTETWSDGISKTSTLGNPQLTRTLTAGVEYTMVFDGTYSSFNSELDAFTKAAAPCLRNIEHWGAATGVTNASYAFSGATNLTGVPDHIPTTITNMASMFKNASSFNDESVQNWNIDKVTNISSMFMGATSFNQPLDDWNTSNVITMANMFNGDINFNQPLESWDTAKVTDMDHMFTGATSFNQPLNDWNTSNVVNMHLMLFGTDFQQDLSNWNMDKVTRMGFMLEHPESANLQKYGHPLMTRMIYQCDTTTTGSIPMENNGLVQTWSDGQTHIKLAGGSPNVKTLTAGTKYVVEVEGNYPSMDASTNINTQAFAKCLTSVDYWGSATTNSAPNAFKGATKLTNVPDSVPALLNITSMFTGATSFNDPSVGKWNVSNATNMTYVFNDATSFNQDISSWNTLKVTTTAYMFNGATSFNQPLDNWTTTSVTNMDHMFFGASNFNQPLNSWNTSNVTNMHMMLFGTAFQQDLSNWNMDKVTRMGLMVPNPESANLQKDSHPLMTRMTYQCDTNTTGRVPMDNSGLVQSWNDGTTHTKQGGGSPNFKTLTAGTKYVVEVEGNYPAMNANDDSATRALSKCLTSVDYWGSSTTSNATAAFIGAAKLTNVPDSVPAFINTSNMFSGATSFNDPDIIKWDMSKVSYSNYMFQNATSFNQDIASWNTAKVYNMSYMFAGATSFNQNLSGWDTTTLIAANGVKFAPSTFNINYLPPKTSL